MAAGGSGGIVTRISDTLSSVATHIAGATQSGTKQYTEELSWLPSAATCR